METKGKDIETQVRCFVRWMPLDPPEYNNEGHPLGAYTLCDYDTGEPVLGPFANQYGEWSTPEEAWEGAIRQGYRCELSDNELDARA